MDPRSRACLLWLTGLLAISGVSSAQSDDDVNAGVQFNFSTPGARSQGMGGAFLASVDDATAAYSNPAGLLQLSKPEVLVEARRWHYEVPFADRGRASGSPTDRGIDTIPGVQLGTAESEIQGISYAAFVLPRRKWALAGFYHRAADFETSFETHGVFNFGLRLRPVQSRYDLEINQMGLSVARQWDSGVAVGFGLSSYSLRLDSFTQRFVPVGFNAPDFDRDFQESFQAQTGSGREPGFSLGLLWDRGSRLSTGLVYRFGPRFDLDITSSTLSPGHPSRRETHFAGIFDLPDVLGGGISSRPSERLTLSLDVNHVYYSQLIEELALLFDNSGLAEDYVLEDVTQIHVGLEYVVTGWRFPIALRTGAWWDPDHRLRNESGSERNQVRFFKGEDLVHGTLGLGWAVGTVQLDVAADVSERQTTASVSAAIRF